jgi:hypothetical protein
MKRIPLKVTEAVDPHGNKVPVDYRAYLRMAISVPSDPRQGIGIDEMRKSMRVLDALDKAPADHCNIEDADYEFLLTKVKASQFNFVHKAFVDFVEDVTNA